MRSLKTHRRTILMSAARLTATDTDDDGDSPDLHPGHRTGCWTPWHRYIPTSGQTTRQSRALPTTTEAKSSYSVTVSVRDSRADDGNGRHRDGCHQNGDRQPDRCKRTPGSSRLLRPAATRSIAENTAAGQPIGAPVVGYGPGHRGYPDSMRLERYRRQRPLQHRCSVHGAVEDQGRVEQGSQGRL